MKNMIDSSIPQSIYDRLANANGRKRRITQIRMHAFRLVGWVDVF